MTLHVVVWERLESGVGHILKHHEPFLGASRELLEVLGNFLGVFKLFLEGLENDDRAILRQGFDTMVILLLRELRRVHFPLYSMQTQCFYKGHPLKNEHAINASVVLKTSGTVDFAIMFGDFFGVAKDKFVILHQKSFNNHNFEVCADVSEPLQFYGFGNDVGLQIAVILNPKTQILLGTSLNNHNFNVREAIKETFVFNEDTF